MKYIVSILSVIGIIVILAIGALTPSSTTEIDYLRIHIRANSNSQVDQDVKYQVKDAVVEALIPLLAEVRTKDEAVRIMTDNFSYIENVANGVLKEEGFNYGSRAVIQNEHFPTRTYDFDGTTLTLEEGDYDALILNLGSGEGNNWWCVVYPAFCFTKTKKFDNFVYISKIWEILKSVIH